MWELRWILLAFGVLILVGVYLWGRGMLRLRPAFRPRNPERFEPHLGFQGSAGEGGAPAASDAGSENRDSFEEIFGPAPARAPQARSDPTPGPAPPAKPERLVGTPPPPPERVVTVRLVPRAKEVKTLKAVHALMQAGLEHGKYSIFHKKAENGGDEPLFSVASLTEPGTFTPETLERGTISGLSFFIVLPGVGDPVARFDAMVVAARTLAVELDAELYDDRGSSWSVQRERYVREEVIEYRHQMERR
ncbi:MAG TPA: cell division protein ZipA C-terminal FtsZ-binding domain-containing protein [Gammaproteobacteria bacterium]